MPSCEICGNGPAEIKIKINNTILSVCQLCAKYGTIIEDNKTKSQKAIPKQVQQQESAEEMLLDNFGKIIERARLEKGLNQKEFAAQLNIPLNVLKLAEAGRRLDLITAKKIEKALKVKLIEKVA